MSRTARTSRRLPSFLLSFVLVLVVGVGVGWAASAVFAPPDDVLGDTAYTYVDVVDGEVGASVTLNSKAVWPAALAGTNQAVGVVTSIDLSDGDAVSAGQVLYKVNLRPVVAAAGSVPAFRPLAKDSQGDDVLQLQAFLTDIGMYNGDMDGGFGPRTEVAVKKWQKSLNLPQDGVVQTGDLLFLPQVPTRVTLDPELISRGAALVGGEEIVSALPVEPTFTIPVTAAQAGMMPVGTQVNIHAEDLTWVAAIVGQKAGEADTLEMLLAGVDGGTVCGVDCGRVAVTGETLLPSQIVTVETVVGAVVPAAALLSKAGGQVVVIDSTGVSHDVTITASARGMAVIEGVETGVSVRIPASEAAK